MDCVPSDEEPRETGEDGGAVLEVVIAAYESAGTGRKAKWPYEGDREKMPAEV